MRVLYIVCYDIADPKRLRRVFSIMRGFGDHLQYSVFRCELSDREKLQLIVKLTGTVKHDEDQVLFFPLGPAGGINESGVHSIGLPYMPKNRGVVVI